MYLVDTDVISSGAPTRNRVHALLAAWMDKNSARLFISTVTVAEIESGIAKARRTGARQKAEHLAAWLETLLHLYSKRILPFDVAAARIAGRLADHARAAGHSPRFADLAIAATAAGNQLTILTRNLRHFLPLGVSAHDPLLELPHD